MTYQGERARPMVSERVRFFEVSKIRLGSNGHVSDAIKRAADSLVAA